MYLEVTFVNMKEFQLLLDKIIIDKDYNCHGSYCWLPYGLKIRDLLFSELKQRVENENYNFVEFPHFIPTSLLEIQKKLFSFEDKVFYVKKLTEKKVTKNVYLRPDGVTQASYFASNWIQHPNDLPLKIANIGPIFRTSAKYPLFSGMGAIMLEAYSFHSNKREALNEIDNNVDFAEKVLKCFFIPSLIVERSLGGNYSISDLTIGYDVPLPFGKTLQACSIYWHGNKYTNIFDVNYELDETLHDVEMCSWGFLDKVLGIMLLLCSDEKGLLLPPNFAPFQVVIVSITTKEVNYSVTEFVEDINSLLVNKGIRTLIDEKKEKLRKRYEYYEKIGVPVRIEIGTRELENKQITVYRRDLDEKVTMNTKDFTENVNKIFDEINTNIWTNNSKDFHQRISHVNSLSSLKKENENNTVKAIGICDLRSCEESINKIISGEILGKSMENVSSKCIVCGKEGKIHYVSRRL